MDEIARSGPLLSSPPVHTRSPVSSANTVNWLQQRLDACRRVFATLTSFVNSNHEDAFGPPGQAGNADAIIQFSRRISAYYREVIEWVHSVRNADVEPRWRKLTYEVSFLADPALRAIEGYGQRILGQVELALKQPPGSSAVLEATLVLEAPDTKRIDRAISEMALNTEGAEISSPAGGPGYLYILTNPSMGNLIKIGRTTRSPRERIEELSASTGIPTPFELAFDVYVEDCVRAEAHVHSRLERGGYRVTKNREFFDVDLTTAIDALLEAQRAVSSHQAVAPAEEAPSNESTEKRSGGFRLPWRRRSER